MGVGSFFKKFAEVATQVAPMALMAFGIPPAATSAIVQGITIAQSMVGATNEQKAAKAASVAQASLVAINAISVQHGQPPIVDENVSADALAGALKLTYDMTKMLHTADGTPMPVAGTPTPTGTLTGTTTDIPGSDPGSFHP